MTRIAGDQSGARVQVITPELPSGQDCSQCWQASQHPGSRTSRKECGEAQYSAVGSGVPLLFSMSSWL